MKSDKAKPSANTAFAKFFQAPQKNKEIMKTEKGKNDKSKPEKAKTIDAKHEDAPKKGMTFKL